MSSQLVARKPLRKPRSSPAAEHWHGTPADAESTFSHVDFLAEPEDGDLAVQEAPLADRDAQPDDNSTTGHESNESQ